MSYSHVDPGQGNTSEINGFGINQSNRDTACTEVSTGLSAVLSSEAAASWQSAAATAWRERLTRVLPMLSASSQVALPWKWAADTYIHELETIAAQVKTARRKIDTGHSMIQAYSWMPTEITLTPEYQQRARDYEDDIDEGNRALYDLQAARWEADSAFVTALNDHSAPAETSDWTALQGLYGNARSVEDILTVRAETIAEANRLADAVEGSGPDTEDIAALAALLDVMASDPSLAGVFWEGRGGDDALELMQSGLRQYMNPDGTVFNSDEEEEAALAFARSIRDSLAAGSNTWTDDVARDFAAQMVTGEDWPGGGDFNASRYQGIGFLFDDAANNPMGVKLTVATADLIDAWERAEGEAGVPRGTSMSGPDASRAWFNALAAADQEDRGGYNSESYGDTPGSSVQDPMSRVLDTLGMYPDAAWEWLSADGDTLANGLPAAATDKVDYYATRDWTSDGWDGFGSLWEGSMGATDGLTSGTYDEATWMKMGDIANQVMGGLVSTQPDPFTGAAISEAGGTNLGLAAGHLMPWTSSNLFLPATGDERGWTVGETSFYNRDFPGMGEIPTPILDNGLINHFWGAVGGSDAGLVQIQAAIDTTASAYFAEANSTNTVDAWEKAFERYGALQGTLAGSVGGVDILQGRYEDAVILQRIEVAAMAVELVPIPGPHLVGFGVDQAIGAGWDNLGNSWANNEASSTRDFFANEQVQGDEIERFMRSVADDDRWGLGTLLRPDSDELNLFISEARGEVQARYGSAGMGGSNSSKDATDG